MGTDIGVWIKEIDYNDQYKYFISYNADEYMSPSLDILRQSLKTMAPKFFKLRNKWVWQCLYLDRYC